MRIMTIIRLILHMRHIDRNTPLTLLRRLINRIKRHRLNIRIGLRQHRRNRRRQRRLAMIHMTNRPNIHMRLRTLKLCLAHDLFSCVKCARGCVLIRRGSWRRSPRQGCRVLVRIH